MKKDYHSQNVSLNPEPDSAQLATFQRHKRNGTSPGNPKWYRSQSIKPRVFQPGRKPVFPSHCIPRVRGDEIPQSAFNYAESNLQHGTWAYVEAYDRERSFKDAYGRT